MRTSMFTDVLNISQEEFDEVANEMEKSVHRNSEFTDVIVDMLKAYRIETTRDKQVYLAGYILGRAIGQNQMMWEKSEGWLGKIRRLFG